MFFLFSLLSPLTIIHASFNHFLSIFTLAFFYVIIIKITYITFTKI
nr:MAG TPA: hypothetical protein [Caudoviricetes sp.]